MKLLTKNLMKLIPPLGTTTNIDPKDIQVYAKFFNPTGIGTWYITEFDGKDTLYGLCCVFEAELGYVSLKELESCKLPHGLRIERNTFYCGSLADAIKYEKYILR
jgi:hypothetical protein